MIMFGPLGQVSLSKGMKTIGAISLHQPADLFHVGLQILQSPFIWLGILLQLMFFVCYMLVLSSGLTIVSSSPPAPRLRRRRPASALHP